MKLVTFLTALACFMVALTFAATNWLQVRESPSPLLSEPEKQALSRGARELRAAIVDVDGTTTAALLTNYAEFLEGHLTGKDPTIGLSDGESVRAFERFLEHRKKKVQMKRNATERNPDESRF